MHHIHEFTARLDWTGASEGPTTTYQSYSRDYSVRLPSGPVLHGTASVAFRGVDSRFNPEDMLIASLAACHMLSYLALCARKKIICTAYSDTPYGRMEQMNGRIRFTEVLLKPVVTISRDSDMDRAIALHHTAHEECFIANSVNFPVLNDPTVRYAD